MTPKGLPRCPVHLRILHVCEGDDRYPETQGYYCPVEDCDVHFDFAGVAS